MAEEENTEEVVEVVEASKGGIGRKLIIGVVATLLVAGGAFAAIQFTKSDETVAEADEAVEEKPSSGPPLYTSLHPPLVINLADASGSSHFMQVTLEVMSRKQDMINAVRDHTPVIRNSLILLYGGELYEEVVTREGKEKMLAEGLAEIRKVMKEQSGLSGIEAIYFTALIVQ